MTDNQQKASDIANRLAINANAYHERARELHDEAERIMRQANVLAMFAAGKSLRETADWLECSPSTVHGDRASYGFVGAGA